MYIHLTLDCIAFSSKSDLTEIKSISRSHSIGTLYKNFFQTVTQFKPFVCNDLL